MFPSTSSFFYTAYGLTIQSELALPELRSIHTVPLADVTISLADLFGNNKSQRSQRDKTYWHGINNAFCMHIAETADFQVTNGNTILVDTIAEPSDLNIRIHLLGTCMGVLIQQRNILPLHASCISKGNECIIISGQSGSGKSTLAMALHKKGYLLLADDICALHFSKENIPYVYPSIPQIKIGADGASALEINISTFTSTLSKHIVPIDKISDNQRHTIKAIFSIEQSNNAQSKIEELHGTRKLAILVKNTYTTPEITKYLGKTSKHFEQCSMLAKGIKIKQIYRTNFLNNLSYLVSVIESGFSNA